VRVRVPPPVTVRAPAPLSVPDSVIVFPAVLIWSAPSSTRGRPEVKADPATCSVPLFKVSVLAGAPRFASLATTTVLPVTVVPPL